MFTYATTPSVFSSALLRTFPTIHPSLAAAAPLRASPFSSLSRARALSPLPASAPGPVAFCSSPVCPRASPLSVSMNSALSSLPSPRSATEAQTQDVPQPGCSASSTLPSNCLPPQPPQSARRRIFHFFPSNRRWASSRGSSLGHAGQAPETAQQDAANGEGSGRVYRRLVSGTEGEKDFRVVLSSGESGKPLSPWHDVPLFASGHPEHPDSQTTEKNATGPVLFNMVVEIPKNTRKKMEIQLDVPFTPIMQDLRKDGTEKGRVKWEVFESSPDTPPATNARDGFAQTPPGARINPNRAVINVLTTHLVAFLLHLGSDLPRPLAVGRLFSLVSPLLLYLFSVLRVCLQILGALAMIDGGELDWKVLAIREGDALFAQLNSIEDVERLCRGVVPGIREWFRWYKLPTDNVVNQFGHDEAALPAPEAVRVVLKAHEHYLRLLREEHEGQGEEAEGEERAGKDENGGARGRRVAVHVVDRTAATNGDKPSGTHTKKLETEDVKKQKLWLPQ
ncbi:putative soluble inorganic pyrophosphatase [Neospora caninum Liverpool]|uniref:inorganic diphosphatase n=1 Tax=Neospora caninum (strain Liverpool) TaxID=572307 RepID=F0VHA3_NEOCL|nr:putative soluble inorganic pyrophosphatase [Neospora caninum Liverpool]CBZ53097.1 putative soluble inorganic pyrophosphatase [Neospora caninum Liverpool]|eukprot:XP_003883129.1 putative soluble inorganic pyrophosphatase [Neospora caninum Liverpool]